MENSKIIIVGNKKSAGLSFLLTLFFGPLGLLYASVKAAIIIIIMSAILFFLAGVFTFGAGNLVLIPVIWVVTLLVSISAVSSHNKQIDYAIRNGGNNENI